MTSVSYTKITQSAEGAIRAHLDAAAKEVEAGNALGASYERGAASGAFDLWQTLSLQHLDALRRASYAADFARLYGLVFSEPTPA
ncbi:hypothetical protein [Caballeronia sp. dw_19]|uniref:hypothetical protein n=1 Tax=Caballeronia sp. dw_19 TaxID=2719791 RepID=UPI001BD6BE72|nr:hypothetical protein [Caballeronia sp. dw_19]